MRLRRRCIKKYGFTVAGVRPHYYKDNNEAALLMDLEKFEFSGGRMSAEEILAQVRRSFMCQKCALYHSRKRSVPGEGPAQAEIMFIGEGPGFHENEQGRPFVGPAGNFSERNYWLRQG